MKNNYKNVGFDILSTIFDATKAKIMVQAGWYGFMIVFLLLHNIPGKMGAALSALWGFWGISCLILGFFWVIVGMYSQYVKEHIRILTFTLPTLYAVPAALIILLTY